MTSERHTSQPTSTGDILAALDRLNHTLEKLSAAIEREQLTQFGKREMCGSGPAFANPVHISKISIHPDQIKPLLADREAVSTDDVLRLLGREISLSGQTRAGRALIVLGWQKKRVRSGNGYTGVYVKPGSWDLI